MLVPVLVCDEVLYVWDLTLSPISACIPVVLPSACKLGEMDLVCAFFFLPSRVVCSLSGFRTPPSARLFCITTVMPSHNAVSSNNWGAYSDFLKLDYKTLEKKFPQPFKLIVLAFFAPNQLGFNLEMLINLVRLVKSLFTPCNQEFCKGCIRSCSPRSAFPRRLGAWNFWGDCIFIPSVHFNGCPWRGRISTSRLCL